MSSLHGTGGSRESPLEQQDVAAMKSPAFRGIGELKAQEAVAVEFLPVRDSRIGELTAKFDIVLSLTPGG